MDKYFKINDYVNGYSIHKILGEGRYGIAYLGKNEKNEKYVIKQLKNEEIDESRAKLFYEEKILQTLNHVKFPKFISRFNDEEREGYILEFMEGEVFSDFVDKNQAFSKEMIYGTGLQLVEIIDLLQKFNIVHRDIRLPNVILTPEHELALIDFGLARFIDNKRYVKEIDYWYLGDFLIFLYYASYQNADEEEKPWYDELELSSTECTFLKKLMGIEQPFRETWEIKQYLEKLKSSI